MNIPLPFPYCPKCKKKYPESYHNKKNCDGLLNIDPLTEIVICSKCNHSWNIWDSRYFCSCGNIFDAKDVKEAVDDLLEDCKLCVEQLEIMEQAKRIRRKIVKESQDSFIKALLSQLGYTGAKLTGYALEMLVEFIKSLFVG